MNIKIKLTEAQLIEVLSSLDNAKFDSIVEQVKLRKHFNTAIKSKTNSVLGVVGKVKTFDDELLEDVLAHRQHSLGLKVDA